MINRFISNDVGREILARSTSLEIRIHRVGGKQLCATYELHGCVGKDPLEGDEDEGELLVAGPNNDAADLQFIADLLGEFARVQP